MMRAVTLKPGVQMSARSITIKVGDSQTVSGLLQVPELNPSAC